MQDWSKAYRSMGGSMPAAPRTLSDGDAVPGMIKLDGLAQGSRARGARPARAPAAGWRASPVDPRGRLTPLSDRPLLCLSVSADGREAVAGGADHALYGFCPRTGKKTRTLFTKTAGHREWVTCVAHAADGRVVSGGMDGQVLLWNASGTRCEALDAGGGGGSGSVALVQCAENGRHALSAGYDKCLRLWDLGVGTGGGRRPRSQSNLRGGGGSGREACVLRGHKGPVLCAAWDEGVILSGDRSGAAVLWDLERGALARRFAGHGGHVTSCCLYAAADAPTRGVVCLTGAQDGRVRVWDPRSRECAAVVDAHVDASGGAGAVGDIRASAGGGKMRPVGGSVVATAGADRAIRVLDPRASFVPRARFAHHRDFIYSLAVVGNLAVSGGGDGMVLVHDLADGRLKYGLGAGRAAVRCLVASEGRLLCAGDDGAAMAFDYE
jgi:WD40 repeat protein